MGLIHASQVKAVSIDEWNCIKLDAENWRHSMLIYERLVCCLHGVDSRVPVIPDDMELKQQLMHDHHDLPTLGHLGAYHVIGSLSS